MLLKNFAWAVIFSATLAVALACWLPLHRDRAWLKAEIADAQTKAAQLEPSKRAAFKRLQEMNAKRESVQNTIQRASQAWSPEQKRWLAVEQAAARLRTEAKTTGGLGRKQTAEPPFPVETSPEKPFFDQLMDDPAYAKAVATLLQQQLEGTYGRLFAALNLNPTDQQRLEDLLTQRLMVGADARGLLGPDASQQERNATKAAEVRRINAEIQSDFGPAVMKQIRDYDGVTRIYNTVDDLETQLSYTTTPLQPAQAEQLVHMIVQILGPRITTVYWSIPQDVIAQSNSMLAPRQIAALKQVQAMQLANIQARDMRQNATDP